MLFPFSKYEGCGNDFVLFDNRSKVFPEPHQEEVRRLCHRQQGIGADGVVLLEESDQADFRMRIFNADGSEAEMCGNGIRCLMKFIHELGIGSVSCAIETMYRRLSVEVNKEGVCVEMGGPTGVRWNVPLTIESTPFTLHLLNTGVPHAVLFVDDIEAFDLAYWGPRVRNHSSFHPQGTNFNVATLLVDGEMALRTYERGVEGETLACGTGATAAALAAAYLANQPSPIAVKTRSNEILTIAFSLQGKKFTEVSMTGPANLIYRGEVILQSNINSNRTSYVCKS